jgi:Protein of unknown function (DUF732)
MVLCRDQGRLIATGMAIALFATACSSSSSGLTQVEQKFVSDVHANTANIPGTDAHIAKIGENVCQEYAAGSNVTAVEQGLVAAGESNRDAISLDHQATADLCPQYGISVGQNT